MESNLPHIDLGEKQHDENRQGEAFQFAEEKLNIPANGKLFYVESYGCALNFNDSEIVATVLNQNGFGITTDYNDADLILINTCSIRENAEQHVRNRLKQFNQIKKQKPETLIGVLGCMAERLKDKLLEQEHLIDMVVGPDAYRTLPDLIKEAESGHKAVNVLLKREETYADISPTRLVSNGVNAFVTIMRGCNNMCSFCVVPFTRGRERSRDAHSIINECTQLFNDGFRDITLLGQNVDSYYWVANQELNEKQTNLNPDERDKNIEGSVNFAQLLELVALINPLLRVRFSTSHPKDITDEVLFTMKKYHNICKQIHLPIQAGNSRVLKLMNRTYTAEWYKAKFDRIREIMPDCAVSTDLICGFCTETDDEHQDTLDMLDYCKFDFAYHFKYSERSGTAAERKMKDDVPEDVKQKRLDEIIVKTRKYSLLKNQNAIGKTFEVLVEGPSYKKPDEEWWGRNTQNQMIIFPKGNLKKGDYIHVKVTKGGTGTLWGELV
ncbi:MAG: tRNA ((37)-C2)-methylthiotransferase MiaB [Bacteroidota bacterium]|jgi:tRNA-2-methylthio-N6-dimethylallyladenosine synthase